MSKFKVGEIVVFAIAEHAEGEKIVGEEAQILEHVGECRNRNPLTGRLTRYDNAYRFESIDGEGICEEYQLKKLPPKDTPTQWEAMKDIFIPNSVEA